MNTASEILNQASTRLGMPILREGWKWDLMNVADAIAELSPSNPQGACGAFQAMHEFTGSDDLRAWQAGKTYQQIAVVMRSAALMAAA